MEDFLETFPEEVTKWETIRDIVDLDFKITDDANKQNSRQIHSVQLLPRQDVMLYGIIPKMEQTSYTKCKECRLVFNPRDILAHRACSRKYHITTSTPNSSKKSKNKRNNSKKSNSSLPPPPVFKKPPSPNISTSSIEKTPPKMSLLALLSKVSGASSTSTNINTIVSPKLEFKVSPSKETPKLNMVYPAELNSNTHSINTCRESGNSSNNHSSGSSSRHKKSKKSSNSSKVIKEADINEINCVVAELCKRQDTPAITIPISTQSVPLLIEKSFAKTEPKIEAIEVYSENKKSLPIVIPLSPKLQAIPLNTENVSTNIEVKTEKIDTDIPQNKIDAVPIVYMPMSPISVITYPQDLKPSKDYYVCFVKSDVKNENVSHCNLDDSNLEIPITTNTPRLYSIPTHNLNIKRYKSHPKPIAVPTYSTKKIGGAILLSNQRIEHQRNDILMAVNRTRGNNSTQSYNRGISLLNHTNSTIRPNILKVKSMNKVNNCKRISNERIMSSDNKQIKLTSNINGFILHSDIIDAPETVLQNNCIQEKIAYFM